MGLSEIRHTHSTIIKEAALEFKCKQRSARRQKLTIGNDGIEQLSWVPPHTAGKVSNENIKVFVLQAVLLKVGMDILPAGFNSTAHILPSHKEHTKDNPYLSTSAWY